LAVVPYPAIAGNAASSHRKPEIGTTWAIKYAQGDRRYRKGPRSFDPRWRMMMRTAIRRLGQALRGLALIMLPALGTSVWAQSPPDLAAAIDDLVAANRILYRQGVVDGFGHISIRHPERRDRFLMSASLAPG